jgi:hypothetical protein
VTIEREHVFEPRRKRHAANEASMPALEPAGTGVAAQPETAAHTATSDEDNDASSASQNANGAADASGVVSTSDAVAAALETVAMAEERVRDLIAAETSMKEIVDELMQTKDRLDTFADNLSVLDDGTTHSASASKSASATSFKSASSSSQSQSPPPPPAPAPASSAHDDRSSTNTADRAEATSEALVWHESPLAALPNNDDDDGNVARAESADHQRASYGADDDDDAPDAHSAESLNAGV